ncbi:hypothetical protein IQ24_01702 [Paracoccus sulfuroxidans]|uniref:Uncharacterized protein n=1 Tax=Paracoccus sulfuroxidans TaxID=384678 RepID=A0A562NSL5_9RHOB|nr:hypothetical protein IQ24_01702 [Paracoccus sulfuroxidans]
MLRLLSHGAQERYLSRIEVQKILRTVEQLPIVEQHGKLLRASQLRGQIGCTVPEAFALYLGGVITPTCRIIGINGIGAILFDVDKIRSVQQAGVRDFISFAAACNALNLHYSVLRALIAQGYIKIEVRKNPDTGYSCAMINAESLGLFRSRFITLIELAKVLRRKAAALSADLADLGVFSVLSGDHRTPIYERSKLPDLSPLSSRCSKLVSTVIRAPEPPPDIPWT